MSLGIVIENGLLVDGTGRPPVDNAVVVVEGNRISYAGTRERAKSSLPSGSEVIDAEGKTILPGLIDAHVHYGGSGGMGAPEEHSPDEVMKRLYGFLVNGVSTVRSCMDVFNPAKQLREQEREDKILIPRLFISGPCFTAPKGHGTEYAREPELLSQMARTPTSETAARKMVRELVEENVNFIKVIIEGRPPFEKLKAELACAIVDEAHKSGFKASVHTHEYKDALAMVKCRADSLEHGAVGIKGPDDEIVGLMKKNGTYYVPTMVVHENTSTEPDKMEAFLGDDQLRRNVSSVTIENIRKATKDPGNRTGARRQDLERRRASMRIVHQDLMKSLKWVKNAGITVVAGSDMGNFLTFPGVSLHRELELLVEAGLSPMEAIEAATRNAAKLLGADDRIGTIEKGKLADVIIVDGKPSLNISDIRKVRTVIKNGRIVKLDELAGKIAK